jgi:hypothetical protein
MLFAMCRAVRAHGKSEQRVPWKHTLPCAMVKAHSKLCCLSCAMWTGTRQIMLLAVCRAVRAHGKHHGSRFAVCHAVRAHGKHDINGRSPLVHFILPCVKSSTRQTLLCRLLFAVSYLSCATHGKIFAVCLSSF